MIAYHILQKPIIVEVRNSTIPTVLRGPLRARSFMLVSAQFSLKFRGESRRLPFAIARQRRVLRRFAETANSRENFADKRQILAREMPYGHFSY